MNRVYFEMDTTGASPQFSRIVRLRAVKICEEESPETNTDKNGKEKNYSIRYFARGADTLSEEQKLLKEFSDFIKESEGLIYPDKKSLKYLKDCMSQYHLPEPDIINEPVTDETDSEMHDVNQTNDKNLKQFLLKELSESDELNICECEMKHFFDDYKNYYYLPIEDTAVHKSVGQFVDQQAKEKASKQTAYIRKTGRFIPAPESAAAVLFRKNYDDREYYCLAEDADVQVLLHNFLESRYTKA